MQNISGYNGHSFVYPKPRFVESKTQTNHGRGEATHSGRAERGGAGLGGAGRDRTAAGRCAQEPTVHLPPKAPKTTALDILSEARTNETICKPTCRVQNPDIPRAGRVGAAQGGAAGRGWVGQDWTPTDRFAMRQPSLLPPNASYTPVLNVCSRHEQAKYKPMGEQKLRLKSGLSARRRPLFVPGS